MNSNFNSLAVNMMLQKQAGQSLPQIIPGLDGDGLSYKGQTIHNAQDPLAEAEGWVAPQAARLNGLEPDLAIVFGLGLGWHFKALRRRWPNIRLAAFEPDVLIKNIYLKNNVVPRGGEPVEFFTDWGRFESFISQQIVHGQTSMPIFLTVPGYKIIWPEAAGTFEHRLDQELMRRAVIDETQKQTSGRFMENLAANIKYISKLPDILGGQKRPPAQAAFLVGSGPSFDLNAHLLREVKNKGLVCAAASALKPLLNLGIRPDLVLALESEDTSTYLELNEQEREVLGDQCVLALAINSHPNHFKAEGFYKTIFYLDPGQAQIFGQSQFLPQGGNAGSAMFALAYLWGLNPLVLVGQDQAYMGTRLHAANAPGDVIEDGLSRNLTVMGIDGSPVETNTGLAASINWFGEAAKSAQQNPDKPRLINATACGARLSGFEHLPLESVLMLLKEPVEPTDLIALTAETTRPDAAEMEADLSQMLRLVESLKKLTKANLRQGAEEIRQMAKVGLFVAKLLEPAQKALGQAAMVKALDQAAAFLKTMLASIKAD